MLAVRHRENATSQLSPLVALEFRRESNAAVMAALQGRTTDDMVRRQQAGHRAYVAVVEGVTAAWGWIATRVADIGELGITFTIAPGEAYLWNFVTLPAFRGRGIYPRLIDHIVRTESATRFWIAYAPENHASAAGVHKAGFVTVAEMSFDALGRAAVRSTVPGGGALASAALGLPEQIERLAPCWRCVRAGRGVMSCPPEACCCDYQEPASGCAA